MDLAEIAGRGVDFVRDNETAFAISLIAGLIVLVAGAVAKFFGHAILAGLRAETGAVHRRPRVEASPPDPPPSVDGFVGREEDLRAYASTIRAGRHRVVAIEGPGGIGKSWLAAKLISDNARGPRRAGRRGPFRRWFWLDCRASPTAEVMVSRLIRFADPAYTDKDLEPWSYAERVARLIDLLGERRRLIVLDNLEALLEPAAARPTFLDPSHGYLLHALAYSEHGAVVLLTSREAAGLGEHGELLGGLDRESGRTFLRRLGVTFSNAVLDEAGEGLGWSPFWLQQFASVAKDTPGDETGRLLERTLADHEWLLEQQWERLTDGARGLMLGLSVFRMPVPREALRYALGRDGRPADEDPARGALHVVRDHHTIERYGDDRWGLHPTWQAFVAARLDGAPAAHRQAAAYWLGQPVPEGLAARNAEDVRPILEAHHHLIVAGDYREAIRLTTEKRFGLTQDEDVTERLTQIGLGTLRLAIEQANAASVDREGDTGLWAVTQGNLGNAYAQLPTGDRADNLRRAVEAFERALTVYTREHYPAEWATAQNNLGNAYRGLPAGDRGENLRRAVEAYEQALTVRTREHYPAQWAATQNNLGAAYADLPTGDRADNLRRAIEACEWALTVYTREHYPAEWAATQNNLGNAYGDLPTGDRAENLRRAIEAYERALTVYTPEHYPADWAMTQNNLGVAYTQLPAGDRAENVRRAVEAYERALTVRTREHYPAEWAATQNNLGAAYSELPTGDRAANLRRAIEAYERTLTVYTREHYPAEWAMTQNNLGNAYAWLPTGDRAANLRRAIEAYERALTVRTREDYPADWAMTQHNLGITYAQFPTGDRGGDLRRAVEAYERALTVYTREQYPVEFERTSAALAATRKALEETSGELPRPIGA